MGVLTTETMTTKRRRTHQNRRVSSRPEEGLLEYIPPPFLHVMCNNYLILDKKGGGRGKSRFQKVEVVFLEGGGGMNKGCLN